MSCAAISCNNKRIDRNETISFFRFPRTKKALSAWMEICDNHKRIKKSCRILCSEHFDSADIITNIDERTGYRHNRKLQSGAVPLKQKSSFPPLKIVDCRTIPDTFQDKAELVVEIKDEIEDNIYDETNEPSTNSYVENLLTEIRTLQNKIQTVEQQNNKLKRQLRMSERKNTYIFDLLKSRLKRSELVKLLD